MKGFVACCCLALGLLFSCTNRKAVPADIIVPDSMRLILRDVIQAEQFATIYIAKDSATRDVNKEMQDIYAKMFALHGVSREKFRRSMDYYATRPDLEKLIFDSLSAMASRERGAAYKDKYGGGDSVKRRKADSLIKANRSAHANDSFPRAIPAITPAARLQAYRDSLMKRHPVRDSLQRKRAVADSVARRKKMRDSLRRFPFQRLPRAVGDPQR